MRWWSRMRDSDVRRSEPTPGCWGYSPRERRRARAEVEVLPRAVDAVTRRGLRGSPICSQQSAFSTDGSRECLPDDPDVMEDDPPSVRPSPAGPAAPCVARVLRVPLDGAVDDGGCSDDEVPLAVRGVMPGRVEGAVDDNPGEARGVVPFEGANCPGLGRFGCALSSPAAGLGNGEVPAGDLPALATALMMARSRFAFCSLSFFLLPFLDLSFLFARASAASSSSIHGGCM